MTGTNGIFGTLYNTYPTCAELWDNVEMLESCRTPILFVNWHGDSYFPADATETCANTAINGCINNNLTFKTSICKEPVCKKYWCLQIAL